MGHLFINTETGEYPRHPGDVELNPTAKWAEVQEVAPPEINYANQYLSEDTPELIDGVYYQKWIVNTLTDEEVVERRKRFTESRLMSVGITVEDLKLLLDL